MKRRKIEEQLRTIAEHLQNAHAYVDRNENVESAALFHLEDWKGTSGHPLWMKNVMIPKTEITRRRKEKALERVIGRELAQSRQKSRERGRIKGQDRA